eukprot:TRINITY_DN67571_c0_g1_i1.p1 TRINITY_DN67571_c0_g1~~TRINITY_DN67571_c0_g1_i1.p1  ORF type:complete len:342 (+),score=44.64 TRINITY_DN67571_c0_g1_i1:37-1026(+)
MASACSAPCGALGSLSDPAIIETICAWLSYEERFRSIRCACRTLRYLLDRAEQRAANMVSVEICTKLCSEGAVFGFQIDEAACWHLLAFAAYDQWKRHASNAFRRDQSTLLAYCFDSERLAFTSGARHSAVTTCEQLLRYAAFQVEQFPQHPLHPYVMRVFQTDQTYSTPASLLVYFAISPAGCKAACYEEIENSSAEARELIDLNGEQWDQCSEVVWNPSTDDEAEASDFTAEDVLVTAFRRIWMINLVPAELPFPTQVAIKLDRPSRCTRFSTHRILTMVLQLQGFVTSCASPEDWELGPWVEGVLVAKVADGRTLLVEDLQALHLV